MLGEALAIGKRMPTAKCSRGCRCYEARRRNDERVLLGGGQALVVGGDDAGARQVLVAHLGESGLAA
jgi:hypothetical protein